MQAPVVVKLGGSAITNKSRICTPRLDIIHNAAKSISAHNDKIIVLHGGGSYAHPFAKGKLLAKGFNSPSGLKAVSEIELNLDQLTRIIGVALLLNNRPFIPIHPMSCITLQLGNLRSSFLDPLVAALGLGVVPILHGDIVVDERRGFGVVSADRIASLLGEKLSVSKVLFGCDVDGVYEDTGNKTVISEVNRANSDKVLRHLRQPKGDVTGGMRGKVSEALRLAKMGVESYIFNLNNPTNLPNLLKGEFAVGTRFLPWK